MTSTTTEAKARKESPKYCFRTFNHFDSKMRGDSEAFLIYFDADEMDAVAEQFYMNLEHAMDYYACSDCRERDASRCTCHQVDRSSLEAFLRTVDVGYWSEHREGCAELYFAEDTWERHVIGVGYRKVSTRTRLWTFHWANVREKRCESEQMFLRTRRFHLGSE